MMTPEERAQECAPTYVTVCAPKQQDVEMQVISICIGALKLLELDQEAQLRVLAYLTSRSKES